MPVMTNPILSVAASPNGKAAALRLLRLRGQTVAGGPSASHAYLETSVTFRTVHSDLPG